MARCDIFEQMIERGNRAFRLESERVAIVILPDKGADIYALIDKTSGIDVLWKSPWGLRRPGNVATAITSQVAWLEAYGGGWQEIFPSGGGPATHRGAELNFHGEASTIAWDCEPVIGEGGAWAELRCGVRLTRSPFRIARTMRIEADSAVLTLSERISNEGGEPAEYMWGHHPAFGAPFLSGACQIDTNAATIIADDAYDPPRSPMTMGQSQSWPLVERDGVQTDLSRVAGPDEPRAALGYFADYAGEDAWYAITNRELGLGVGMVWRRSAFPHAWFWQEQHASPGYPWYQGVYVMAIEPGTSYPGQGITNVVAKTGTHRTLAPGESAIAELRAILFAGTSGVRGIDGQGNVSLKEEA